MLRSPAKRAESYLPAPWLAPFQPLVRPLCCLPPYTPRRQAGVASPCLTAAEMIGTTRSRVSFFMNKFRKLGFIEYNGKLEVHNSLLKVVLHDKPEIKTRDQAISAA